MFVSCLIKFSYFVSHQQTIELNSTNHLPYFIQHSIVVPTKSDSDEIVCLQSLRKTLTCTLHPS